MKRIKQYVVIVASVVILTTVPAGCGSRTDDYHQSNDDQWLIEQVEKGYLTQEQADAIREQQNQN